MTTRAEIDKQIDADIERYNNSVYDGNVPDSFVEYFKKALMIIPPAAHKYKMGFLDALIKKHKSVITNLELGMMINLIYACPFKDIYSSLEEGIEITKQFDAVREEYNQKSSDIERQLMKKKQRLLSLSGIVGSADLGSGMAIVKAEA